MRLLIVCLFPICACGLPTHTPVTGVYDLTTNDVTKDSPAGCGAGMAAPMTIDLVETAGSYSLYVCGPVGADCSQEQLYATSADGYAFNIVAMFSGAFSMAYDTTNGHTTISGTGRTEVTGYCIWMTAFDGTKR